MFKIQDNNIIDVEELIGDNIFPILDACLPELSTALRIIPAKLRPSFFRASYRYGTIIIDADGMYLPLNNGENVSFNDPRLPDRLKEGLSYNPIFSNPVGIVLNKTCEFFVQNDQRIVPYVTLQPGETFGLGPILDDATSLTPKPRTGSIFQWDLMAGARSIFMLSKVAHKPQHIKLQKQYGISASIPKTYEDQWHIFKELAYNSSWRAEILFFDNKWFDLLKHPKYGPLLYMQLSAVHKLTSRIWHHMTSWDSVYGQIEFKKSLTDYPIDILYTAKHLFAISAKCALGFRPATDDSSAPIELIQEAYKTGYQLEYCPTIMEPATFCLENKLPVYYSINHPTLPQYSPDKNHPGKRIIATLFKLKQVMELYQISIQRVQGIRAKTLLSAAVKVEFSYYHDAPKDYINIKNAILVPEEDKRFILKANSNFPYSNSFVNGLIKISPKES